MSDYSRPTLPAIVTDPSSSSSPSSADAYTGRPAPSTPPMGGHARAASMTNTPVFVVTPSGGDDTADDISPTTDRRVPSHNGSSTTQPQQPQAYPPSPTLSAGSSTGNRLRSASNPRGGRGHSPTKSVDSAFQNKLDTYAREQQKNLHSRRGSELTGTTALHGSRAEDELDNPAGLGKREVDSSLAGVGGAKKLYETRRAGFLGKIPLLKYLAKKEEVEVDEDGEVVETEEDTKKGKKKNKVILDLPDPSPQEMGPFASLPPSKLYKLIDPKDTNYLTTLGGSDGLINGLYTNPSRGLSESHSSTPGASIDERRKIYGENRLPARKSKTLLQLMWLAYQDKVLLLLSVAAVVSLALGIYTVVGTPAETYQAPGCPGPNETCTLPHVDWVEGVAITVAILIVVLVGSLNDYQKELQFRKLNAQKEARNVKCIRDGSERLMSVYDIVVGDICVLEPGEIVPVDGVFLSGHNVKCDESSATGESDLVRKQPYETCIKEAEERGGNAKSDPFLLSGSKIAEGSGQYLVTSVGQHSFLGKIMLRLATPAETTPLQLKLNRLAEIIAKLGSLAGLILFASLMIRFFTNLSNPGQTADDKAQAFIQILIISVTIIVVAVPEGLPLAVTLALAFATRRMTKQNLLVRVLGSCETMGTATVICTDKTGTLTQNKMSVVAGSIGVHLKFAERLEETKRTNANSESTAQLNTPPKDFSLDITELKQHLSRPLQEAMNESIAINSTAFEGKDEHGTVGFVGSKTETALMTFAVEQGWGDYKPVREGAQVVEMVPFSSERKAMGVVVKHGKGYRLYIKGASEVLFKLSTSHVVVSEGDTSATQIQTTPFDEYTTNNIDRTIIFYANQSLRTIALCYRDFESWPPAPPVDGTVPYDSMARDLTLLGIVAIEDPLREGVTEAVKTAQRAGVAVKMCTGDNVLTARSIATQCGIFTPGGLIMEGPAFRELSKSEKKAIAPRLQVLARSSPSDKQDLVDALKSLGEVVGVTGDGANDAPALKHANVGFAMGIAGTEVAKEASDIILMDDNFASIVTAISWGRCVNDSVKKFLQFQISVNITAVLTTFITAVSSDEEESVLTAVQLLWVNLIMDTFAALALATDPADPENLQRKPDRKMAPLISADMWKMIVGQSAYQMIVALVLHFKGHDIFGYHSQQLNVQLAQDAALKTLIFNQFVFCQIFNMLNARRLDRTLNILRGIHKNYYFIAIWAIMIGGQALIVNVGGAAFQVTRIDGVLWAVSIIIGLMSLPLAVLIRLVPTAPIERFMIRMKFLPDPNALPTTDPTADDENEKSGLEKLEDNLRLYHKFRGGRINASSLVRKRKVKKLEEKEVFATSLMAMIPSMIMAMPGAGDRLTSGNLGNPAALQPSPSSERLYQGAPGVHPGTDSNDPMAKRYGGLEVPPAARTKTHTRGGSQTLEVPTFGYPGMSPVASSVSGESYIKHG